MRIGQLLPILSVALLLGSCGWQLKGNLQAEMDLDRVFFDSRIPTYERSPDSIETTIKRRFDQTGTDVTASLNPEDIGLILISEEIDESVLSLTSDLFEQQVKLQKVVTYQIIHGEEILVANNSVTTSRSIAADQSAASAKRRERDLIIGEMNRELADRIILHMQRIAAEQNANPS